MKIDAACLKLPVGLPAICMCIQADASGFVTLYEDLSFADAWRTVVGCAWQLAFPEVDSKCADLWAAFRAWCADTFSSPEELVGAQATPNVLFKLRSAAVTIATFQVTQLRGSIVELGPPEGERRVFKKQKSAVPPVEPWPV